MKKYITIGMYLLIICSLGIGCNKSQKESPAPSVTLHESNNPANVTPSPSPGQVTAGDNNLNTPSGTNIDANDNDASNGSFTQEDQYNQAIHFIKLKRYPHALGMLSDIKDYKNSKLLIDQLRYLMNASYLSNGYQAIGAITKVGGVTIGYLGKDSNKFETVNAWKDIQSIYFTTIDCLQGLTKDGSIISSNKKPIIMNNTPIITIQQALASWKNMKAIETNYPSSAIALDYYGNVFFSELSGSSYEDGSVKLNGWDNIVAVELGDTYIAGLKEDGTVLNKLCDSSTLIDIPVTSDWKNIVAISGGKSLVGLKEDGTVVVTGCNELTKKSLSTWQDIIAISASGNTILGLKRDGTVVANGSAPTGPKAVKGWTDIVAIKAGYNFSIGLKADGSMVLAGDSDDSGVKTPDVSVMKNLYIPTIDLQIDSVLPTPSPGYCDIKAPVTPSNDSDPLTGLEKLEANNLHVTPDGEVHLNGYDSFNDYNKDHSFGNFNISETWVDQIPYYQFTNGKIKILSDSRGDNWIVNNGKIKKKINYSGGLSINNSHSGTYLQLKDCLSTGKPQLIMVQSSVAMDTAIESINFYNIDTLKEYKLENYADKLKDFVKMKVVSLNKKEVTLKITCSNGKEYEVKNEAIYDKKSDYHIRFNSFNSFDTSKKGKLYVTHFVNSNQHTVVGKVTGELVYDGSKIVLKKNTLRFSKYTPE